jgi:transposase-like protein
MQTETIRYSEAFKRQVVKELEDGKFLSFSEARRAYGILGLATIQRWVRQYGNEKILPKKVKIETMKERDELKEAKKRIRELEAALADAHIDHALSDAYVQIACERMGEDPASFKKKHGITLSDLRKKGSDRGFR